MVGEHIPYLNISFQNYAAKYCSTCRFVSMYNYFKTFYWKQVMSSSVNKQEAHDFTFLNKIINISCNERTIV